MCRSDPPETGVLEVTQEQQWIRFLNAAEERAEEEANDARRSSLNGAIPATVGDGSNGEWKFPKSLLQEPTAGDEVPQIWIEGK